MRRNGTVKPTRLLIQWPFLGPYHLARLRASADRGREEHIEVIGLEIAGQDITYAWQTSVEKASIKAFTLFPEMTNEEIDWMTMRQALWQKMDALQPDVVAISGYANRAAQLLLAWCRLRSRSAILMSDSKADDSPVRSMWKEWLKGVIVGQYSAALCAGTPHRVYLEQLGMNPDKIFLGYDVVDNNYFRQQSECARMDPAACRHLPGLASSEPYFLASARFVRRKNLDWLVLAYQRYRTQLKGLGKNPWRLVILGDGQERNNLEHLIISERIQGVSLPGFMQVAVLPAYYGLASAFIHPPLVEQWGLVVNEAMAAGLPVLVSDRCGCAPDLVIDGVTGMLFDPLDLAGLADLLVRVTTDAIDLEVIGQAAKEHIGTWGLDRFGSSMIAATKYACTN